MPERPFLPPHMTGSLKARYRSSLATSLLVAGLLAGGAFAAQAASITAGSGNTSQSVLAAKTGQSAALASALGGDLANLPEFGNNFSSFMLGNGLQVVVIPDHRAPVATHMIWYKVGAADEKPGESGIAHFLEHLMFKGTTDHPDGEFSRIVASVGGQENAFTSQDYTAYFQRVSKEHLGRMMELEADRMANLVLRDDQVAPELQVIHEERASRVDNNPSAQLGEALSAALYRNHPYGIPIIGWDHEIADLNRQTALDFYNLYYTPNNAILVVAGDVTEAEVKELAEKTYGKVARRAEPGERLRPIEPPQRTARTLTLRHERVKQTSIRRAFVVPSDTTAKDGESEALELLGYILGSGTNSRLYQSLIIKQKIATSAGAYYDGSGLNDSSFNFYGTPTPGNSLDDLMAAVEAELALLIKDGVTDEELARAKRAMLADTFYAQDSQVTLARIVGANLTSGSNLDKLRSWPKRLAATNKQALVDVAKKYLNKSQSVTGYLLPPEAKTKPVAAAPKMKDADKETGTDSVASTKRHPAAVPKVAPRVSQKVPAPRIRPVKTMKQTPKPKPQPDTSAAPKAADTAMTKKG